MKIIDEFPIQKHAEFRLFSTCLQSDKYDFVGVSLDFDVFLVHYKTTCLDRLHNDLQRLLPHLFPDYFIACGRTDSRQLLFGRTFAYIHHPFDRAAFHARRFKFCAYLLLFTLQTRFKGLPHKAFSCSN